MKKYRHEQILQLLSEQGSAQIGELAICFGVTPMTIRRDLSELEAKGALVRTHGGAMPIRQTVAVDTPFHYRQAIASEAKQKIAQAAVKLVSPGQRLFLASGTTLHAFAGALMSIPALTVVTDAVNIANDFCSSNMNIIQLGGEVRGTTSSTTGEMAENQLKAFYFDAAFLGVTAVDAEGSLYLGSLAELGIDRQLFTMTKNIYVLADSSKVGRTDFVRIGEMLGYTLITDSGISPALRDLYQALGIKVIVVDL